MRVLGAAGPGPSTLGRQAMPGRKAKSGVHARGLFRLGPDGIRNVKLVEYGEEHRTSSFCTSHWHLSSTQADQGQHLRLAFR